MLLYSLRLAWWNTALSPSAPQAKSKSNENTYLIVCNHIRTLLQEHSCDFLALCEVSSADVEYLAENLGLENISFIDLTHDVGRTRFDIAVIYKNNKINVTHDNFISKIVTDRTIKVAQKITIENIDDLNTIHVFLCHWASRLNGDGATKRFESARLLREKTIELMGNGDDVILMGDFNDNPYDISLNDILLASRCHDAVMKYPKEYFYNPFWRTVVSDRKFSYAEMGKSFRSGSHKFKEFSGTIWHSYDQIIVSGSFLNNGYWCLNEYATKVMTFDTIVDDYNNPSSFIDHLPVVCEITRP